jgi:LacI family transcriptional regulator
VGIFAVNDYRAQLVASACRLCALRVPSEVGIMGADNNQVLCEFHAPTLTSVDCDWYRVGFEAAALLDRLMNGDPRPADDLLVPPKGVVRRASTDFRVVDDSRLVLALGYVRDHLGEVFGVERLIAVSGASRRTLEFAFLRELGCSPYHYLCRQRVERAKQLLREAPRKTFAEISRSCGFHDARRFREVFRRVEQTTPARYRQSHATSRP